MGKDKGLGGLLAIIAPKSDGGQKDELAADVIRAVKEGKPAELAGALEAFMECCKGEESEED